MLGYESTIVNSQLINVAPGQAYSPLTFGSQYTGPGMWPRNGVFNTPPVMPSASSVQGGSMGGMGGDAYGGGHPMPTAGSITSNGDANYFSIKHSPLIWAVVFLAAGLGMLHFIHYSK